MTKFFLEARAFSTKIIRISFDILRLRKELEIFGFGVVDKC